MYLVSRELPFARELIRELVRARGALVGWEPATLRGLAAEFAAPALDAADVRPADDLVLQAAADDALDATTAALPAPLRRQAGSIGFRGAVFDAFSELRLAGVTPHQLASGAGDGSPARALAPAYARYCELLSERRLADSADAFRAALQALPAALDEGSQIVIEPGAADVSGMPRAFLDALVDRGAIVLKSSHAPPDWTKLDVKWTLARAATPALEVRDALRHALHTGARWDEVELATTDVDTYGVALAALGDELRIPYTLKQGVPIVRTRAGRALERYFRWLQDDLPATAIREALEQGEIMPPAEVPAAELARAIRNAAIGWGAPRWRAARDRLPADADATVSLVARLINLIPGTADDKRELMDVAITTAQLATMALTWLAMVERPDDSENDQQALDRLRGRLTQLTEQSRPPRSLSAALAEVRGALEDLRAFPSIDDARAGRTSRPGAVHLTHMSQAGSTGRPHVYLLGMDAQRTSGALPVDPILDDDTRKALGPALPSTRERADRRDRALYRALNGLHGSVRVSYATQSDAGPREASPSPVLLQMARHVLAQPELTYDQFRAELGEPAGAARGNDPLDRRDVWLRALAGGPLMLDGRAQVRAAWPSLARGLRLHAAADGDAVTEWHGMVPDAAGKTRPFADASRWTSPSSLELLGACPLAWFYRYALELRLPEDEQRDATQWLDPAQRGVVLHRVLERFVREWMSRQGELDGDPARDALLAVLDDELERERQTTPPPSELAFLRDRVWADRAARHFLFQEREWRDAEWLSVEAHFPAAGDRAEFVAADGTRLAIGGRIDRVDRYPDGSLRIVDYKSGSNYAYRDLNRNGLLNGGRVLQPAIYAAGAGQALGSEIRQFEYRFTKGHPPDDRIALDADALAGAPAIVASLLTHLRSGQFIPTDCADDCKFCDFRSICRVQGTDPVRSPRAEWGKEHGAGASEYAEMRKRRGEEGEP